MRSSARRHRWPTAVVAFALSVAAADSPGIEMFTYFGDGSRIGLPSLEVPIEAYPGIPLRSDRIRARRRAQQMGPNAATRIGPPGYTRGITIRAMPTTEPPAAPPRTNAAPPMPPEPILFDDAPVEEPADQPAEKARGEAETISAPAPAS